MKISKKFYLLSSFMLLLIIFNSLIQISQFSQLSKKSDLTELMNSNMAETETIFPPRYEEGITISYDNVTLSTDKKSYTPGEWATITAEGSTNEINGSLEWQLESPKLGEIAFDFKSYYQDIFSDPYFDDSSIPHPDWENDSFYSMSTNSGYLNLTQIEDDDIEDALVIFNKTKLDVSTILNPEKYVISFDYYSQGENLLLNPGFESGTLDGWETLPGNVTIGTAEENASEGINYAIINSTTGKFVIYQNVSFLTPVGSDRYITFSVKATGRNTDNYWSIRLEAYNDTDTKTAKGVINASPDSRSFSADEKGYIFNKILKWHVPTNTSYIRAIFVGYDTDSKNDNHYTGWLDECILSEVPGSLIFQYWGWNEPTSYYKNITLSAGEHEWKNGKYEVEIDNKIPLSKTFAFILPDTNSYKSNVTSYWLIDNISVNYATIPSKSVYVLPGDEVSGIIRSTWFHRGFRENFMSNFSILTTEVTSDKPGRCTTTIEIQLPKHQVYFGSWHFNFTVYRAGADLGNFIISFPIEESMNFIVQDTYLLRGFTNESVGEEYNYIEYFEHETNIEVISPGDNVTLLGYLEANSTPSEWYDLNYLDIGSFSSDYFWNSSSKKMDNVFWSSAGYIKFNSLGETLLDGNFTYPLNNSNIIAINFQLPIQGIYGNLSANMTFSLKSNNIKSTGGGFPNIDIIIPISLPIVKFYINITNENLPEENYYLTEYLDGDITVECLNYNNSLETNFPDRNISSLIDIPMTDLDLTIFLDDLNRTPFEVEVSQEFHYNFIEKTIFWLDPINPHILSGTYAFLIRWNSPYKLGIENQVFLSTTDLNITIKGTLEVVSYEETIKIQQGGLKTINFTVKLVEKDIIVGGLILNALISENSSLGILSVYEEDNTYKTTLAIKTDMDLGIYAINIFVIGQSSPIGDIAFEIIESQIDGESDQDISKLIFSTVGFGFFVLSASATSILLLILNKKMK